MQVTNLCARLKTLLGKAVKSRTNHLAAAVVAGGMMFSGAAQAADLVNDGGFELNDGSWTINFASIYTHPYGGINGPQLTEVGTLNDYGYNDNLSAAAESNFHGLDSDQKGTGFGSQVLDLVNSDLTAQQILDGNGRFAFSAWLATCCGDDPKVTATFNDAGSTAYTFNRGISTHLSTTADILVNPGGVDNATSMAVDTDASRRYWALYEVKGAIPSDATQVTILLGDGRVDAGIDTGNGNDNYFDMVMFDAVGVVPEPGTIALAGLGLTAGLATFRRRR